MRQILALTVCALVVGTAAGQAPQPQKQPAQKATKVIGTVTNVKKDQITVHTADKRDLVLHTNPQTKIHHKGKPFPITEIREGAPITFEYLLGEPNIVQEIVVTPAELIEGELLRIDQGNMVIRHGGNEVVVVVDPLIPIFYEGRFIPIRELVPGSHVRIHTDVRNQRHFAHSVWGQKRK